MGSRASACPPTAVLSGLGRGARGRHTALKRATSGRAPTRARAWHSAPVLTRQASGCAHSHQPLTQPRRDLPQAGGRVQVHGDTEEDRGTGRQLAHPPLPHATGVDHRLHRGRRHDRRECGQRELRRRAPAATCRIISMGWLLVGR